MNIYQTNFDNICKKNKNKNYTALKHTAVFQFNYTKVKESILATYFATMADLSLTQVVYASDFDALILQLILP